MALDLRWVSEDELDRVAETRMRCYAPAARDIERYKQGIRNDQRARPGDFLLAEQDGEAVGTSTSLSMTMWVRGAAVPCQGVAYVGTIKTQRRSGGGEKGIATQMMEQTLRLAREREQVVSALMPFRASYYEHFGYGIVERRSEWVVPMAALPGGAGGPFRFMRPDDIDGMAAARQRMVRRGQCDIERTPQGWAYAQTYWPEGYVVVDPPAEDEPIRSWMYLVEVKQDNRTLIRVADHCWETPADLLRQLGFLATLRDQYSAAILQLPVDLPFNWALKERQLPHRPVEHPAASLRSFTRMQVRVLDHRRFLEALNLPAAAQGRVRVAVAETEGRVCPLEIELGCGKMHVTGTTAPPDIECPDTVWAAIACGEMSAGEAARWGLIRVNEAGALRLLDDLARGPKPFCNEYF